MSERTTEELTAERGENYGHPYDHFNCTQSMWQIWRERARDGNVIPDMDEKLQQPLSHIVYMICDKLARMAENPLHMDNFYDIQGYASLWEKCVERHKERV